MKLIKQVSVYAPEYLGIKDVLVCGGKIEWIRDEINLSDPECEVIDGRGKILIPGLIDKHVHITGGGGEGSFHTKAPEVQLSALIKGGITTVLGLLGTDGITRSVENLISKAKALKEEGISCYALSGAYGFPSVNICGSVERDIAFIDEIIGVKLAISDHRAPNLTNDQLIALASQARTAGMLSGKAGIVVLHMGSDSHGLEPVFDALERTSIPIKTFQPTHVGRNDLLYSHAIRFAQMGGYIDLTAGSRHKKTLRRINEAKKAGVDTSRITISSDGQGSWSKYDAQGHLTGIGVSSVSAIFDTFCYLVEQGMDISEAASYVTSNVADSLELSHKGRIGEGMDADLVMLNNDLSVDLVMAMGRCMLQNGNLLVKGTYEV